MRKPAPFTIASLRRAIEAVRQAGLHVTAVRPDGTILVSESPPASEDTERKPDAQREIIL